MLFITLALGSSWIEATVSSSWRRSHKGLEKGEEEAGIGTIEFIGGEGFYKSLIGKKCKYAIRYFRADVFFFQQVCKL